MYFTSPIFTALVMIILTTLNHASIVEIGDNDFIISQVAGTQNNPGIDAISPAMAFNSINNTYISVWSENSDPAGNEIYARLMGVDGMPMGNQVNISDISNSDNLQAFGPKVTFNHNRNEYFVVWYANDFEIYGRRITADLMVIGAEIPLSEINQLPFRGATGPDVAYNKSADEYFVVWYADDPAAGLVDDEFEVFGQRLTGEGIEIGDNDFRISDVAGTGDASRSVVSARVAFNVISDEYLVIWVADDDQEGQVDQEFEVFGQLLNASGSEVGANDFRISTMGGIGAVEFDVGFAAVAANNNNGDWLVVWHGDDNSQGLVDQENEIHGMLLNGAGQLLNQMRISTMGGTGNIGYQAYRPDVVFNSMTGEYLISFQGDGRTYHGAGPDEYEIWTQRMSETGMLIGNAKVISDMGDNGSEYDARTSALAFNHKGETLVVWNGSDDTYGGAVGEFGVFGQKLAETPIFADGFD